jgi:YD repeat-containing protein
MWVPTATYLPYPQSKVGVSGNYEFFVVSSFDRYPTVLLSTETTDYLKGTSDKVEYKAYDFYNGSATEIITKDSYGNVFKNKVTPAYRQSSYAGMGLKMNGYSNMLSQTFKNEVFKVSPSNYNTDLGLMSSKVMTWTDNMNYRVYNSGTAYAETAVTENTSTLQKEKFYRPSAAYVWNSPLLNNDGSYSSSFVDFDPSSIHANWKKTTEQTLSNPWSVPLSSKDLNGNYSSQRLTKKKSLVHSQAANANHSSYTYASFEDFDEDYSFMEGELTRGYSPSSGVYYARTAFSAPHTGKYVAQVISGYPVSFNTLICPSCSDQVGKQYRASVWIHESSASGAALTMTVNGTVYTGAPPPAPSTTSATASTSAGITQAIAKSGQWYLVNVEFVIPANFIGTSGVSVSLSSSNGTAYFDDFRFHPIDSDVQGYVYDETTWQPTHVLDKDNFYTRYEYDNSGRLKTIYRETVNGEMKIEDRKYNVVKP